MKSKKAEMPTCSQCGNASQWNAISVRASRMTATCGVCRTVSTTAVKGFITIGGIRLGG